MTAPLSMGRVALTVNDLEGTSAFYRQAVGLHPLDADAGTVRLGAGDTVLLELRRDASARRRSQREAGLFHTAFLLPTRADLGAWARHASEARAPVVGASDHVVSEAIYLTDPEGNGVEIYADRPAAGWRRQDGLVVMRTDALDVEDLLASAGTLRWQGFPARSTIGHVHLQVGAIAPAEAFYAGTLGLAVTSRYPGGTFYAAGEYHHHLATNIWSSRGAGVRSEPSTGLADVELILEPEMLQAVRTRLAATTPTAAEDRTRLSLTDPWGTRITLVAGQQAVEEAFAEASAS